jgi:adenosylcobinamide-GDP ribazoletransferase
VLSALGFLTPIGPARRPGPSTPRWFPLVGAGVGAAVGAVWWAASRAWRGPLIPAGLALVADLALTGMLHVDGLADSADGLLAHLSRQRRLAVMAEPDVGAFGLAATVGALLLRFAAFATLRPDIGLVAGVWCVSRSLMTGTLLALPYARHDGLVTAFLGGRRSVTASAASLGIAAGAALAAWSAGAIALAGIGAGAAAAAGVSWLAARRLGGFTGDVLGAVVVVSETVALVVAAIHT